ncbi:hypothetical protein, partial [Vibrio cholerae]|uniref:hypothetical protein n=1 Tax=Vibrio cholerae TaxID=666 RepID=UPI001F1A4D9F
MPQTISISILIFFPNHQVIPNKKINTLIRPSIPLDANPTWSMQKISQKHIFGMFLHVSDFNHVFDDFFFTQI